MTMQLIIGVLAIFFSGFGVGLLVKQNIIKESIGDIMVDEIEGPLLIFDSQEALDTLHKKKYVVFRIRKKNKS